MQLNVTANKARLKIKASMSDVRTVKLKFSDLVFLEDNPRTIKKENLERLAERIKSDPTFFENRSCLVNFTDGKYVCYAGFQRAHAAAKILKWKEIPCSVENDVPEKLMRKRAIVDNTHDGDWDAHVLGNWEFEQDEYREMGVPDFVFGGGADGLTDEEMQRFFEQSGNGETLENKQKLILEYADDELPVVKEALLKIAKTPEQAVWQLLGLD